MISYRADWALKRKTQLNLTGNERRGLAASLRYSLLSLCLATCSSSVWAEDLVSIYNKALIADPKLKSAQHKVMLGEAQEGQAVGAMLPQINANLNWSLNKRETQPVGLIPGNVSSYEGERYNISLTQSVFDVGKIWEWRRTVHTIEQYEEEQQDAEQTLILDVVERYFIALEAADNLDLVDQEIRSTETQLAQLQKQYKKQLIKLTDVLEVEAKLNGLQADRIEAETQWVVAREGLFELTGAPIGELIRLSPNVEFEPIDGTLEFWLDIAQGGNASLKATEKSIDAASSDLAKQKSQHLPVVDVQLGYYFTNTGFESAQQPGEPQTQVAALNVRVPIFSGGAMTKRVDEAAQRLEIAKQENIAKNRELIKQVRESYLNTNASLRRIDAEHTNLESSLKSRDAMEKGFKYGVQTISDVLISQARVFRAKRDLLKAQYQYIKYSMWFKKLTGDINFEILNGINAWLQSKGADNKG